jgi:hypothetical protein
MRSGGISWTFVPSARLMSMSRSLVLAAVAASFVVLPATALAKGQIFFEDAVPAGKSSYVRFNTHKPASFRVVLRVPTQGRAQLFLLGRKAPKGGPLIDTRTSSCEGAAGSFFCRASFEPLPKGTYTWRIRWLGKQPAHVELTVRW